MYSYGEPVGMTNDSGTSYFGTDILGSVRSVTDKYGTVQSSYDYDAFGSPYLGNLENNIGFGYCGKVYDNGTGLYDYGFRDYSPVSARFTTVDPIRDGSNWFSYVVNDPVNYVDPLGLTASDSKVSVESNVSNDSSIVTTVTQTEASTTTTATTATQTAATTANITQSGNAQTQFTSFAQAPSVSMPVTSAPPVNTAGVFISSIGRSHTNGIGQDSGGNSAQVSSSTLSEKIHKFLDVAGCFGDIPDVINAVIYLFEGNYKEAGWSASSLIPFTEIASKGRKVALNVIPEIVEFSGKHGDEVVETIRTTRRQSFRQAKIANGIPKSAQFNTHKFVFDGSTENRMVWEFEIDGKKKYIIEHAEDKYGRGKHFHGAVDSISSDGKIQTPFEKGTYKQLDGHFPEDINGFN